MLFPALSFGTYLITLVQPLALVLMLMLVLLVLAVVLAVVLLALALALVLALRVDLLLGRMVVRFCFTFSRLLCPSALAGSGAAIPPGWDSNVPPRGYCCTRSS